MTKHRMHILVEFTTVREGKYHGDGVLNKAISQAIHDLAYPKHRVHSVEFENDEAPEDFAARMGQDIYFASDPDEFVFLNGEGEAISVYYDTEPAHYWRSR